MLMVARCIYCAYWKPVEAFNTEHVVHKAFGTFGAETPVLKCVCSHCNKTLGDEVDRKFTRDSVEALERVKAGLTSPANYKTEGKRSTLYVEFDKEGPFRGSRGYHVPDSSGSELAVTPLPQIGFARTETETPEWFTLDQLPTKEELRTRGVQRRDAGVRRNARRGD
jgi:hypothetical protein